MSGRFSKQRIVAAPGFNRWWVPPASVAITWLRERTRRTAIRALTEVANDQDFKLSFAAPVSDRPTLLEAITVTSEKLLETAPAGTVDPTASLYNSTMFLMAGFDGAGTRRKTVNPSGQCQVSLARLMPPTKPGRQNPSADSHHKSGI